MTKLEYVRESLAVARIYFAMHFGSTPAQQARHDTYLSEMESAFALTKRLGADLPALSLYPMGAINRETADVLRQLAFPALQQQDVAPAECVLSAQVLAVAARELFKPAPAYLTLGYVDAPWGECLYQFGAAELRTWLAFPSARPRLPLHAWVTLATLDIWDASLISGLRGRETPPFHSTLDGDPVLVDSPRDWTCGFVYHPVAVGEDLLRRLTT